MSASKDSKACEEGWLGLSPAATTALTASASFVLGASVYWLYKQSKKHGCSSSGVRCGRRGGGAPPSSHVLLIKYEQKAKDLLALASKSALGRELRASSFDLCSAPEWNFLNHGSYGTLPKYVGMKQKEWILRMEQNPDLWFRESVYADTRAGLARLSKTRFFRVADPMDLVFVQNATNAMHSVFSSLANSKTLKKGDRVLITDLIYPAVKHSVIECCERVGAEIIQVEIKLPITHADTIVDAVKSAMNQYERITVALFDHITSSTGCILPVPELSKLCRERNILCVVDGAHAVGQIPLDFTISGELSAVDIYCSNFHKWLFAPKGCAVLFARGSAIHSWLQPCVTSHEWKNPDWTKKFNMQGTNDASAYLCMSDALTFIEDLGGWDKLNAYRRGLLEQVVKHVTTERKGWAATTTTSGGAGGSGGSDSGSVTVCPESMRGYMALVSTPFPETASEIALAEQQRKAGRVEPPKVSARSAWLMNTLLKDYRTVLPVMSQGGKIWVRFSAQVYNSRAEYDTVLSVIDSLIADPKKFESDPVANVLPVGGGGFIPSMDYVLAKSAK